MKRTRSCTSGSVAVRLLAASIVLMIAVFYLLTRWDPEEQVTRHQIAAISALENRNWKKIDALLAADFKDNAGHDKEWALKEPREALRHFLTLTIAAKEPTVVIRYPRSDSEKMQGTVTTWLHFDGNGSPLAHMIKDAANSTKDPFSFTWRKESWKPWDWKLIAISHPLLLQAPHAY